MSEWTNASHARTLYAAAEILYWLLANNPPNRGPLYWTQMQWDECEEIRQAIRKMASARTRRIANR